MVTPVEIKIDNLMKRFLKAGNPALSSMTAAIAPGRITGLLGADGAGKTTLMRLIAGVLKPTTGSIHIHGFDTVTDQSSAHNLIGYMPQQFSLYEDLSVLENLNLYADILQLSARQRADQFDKIFHATQMMPFQKRLTGQLSGGMKQKLGLACVFLKQPKILLLDEPSVGLDPIVRIELWNLMKTMVTQGTTVLWSTSYAQEAALCDIVLVLKEGCLLFEGKPSLLVDGVKGCVYESKSIRGDKRKILQETLKYPSIIDAVVRGNKIKVILNKQGNLPVELREDLDFQPLESTFEDGFIALLGGVKIRTSPIVDLFELSENYNQTEVIQVNQLTKQYGDFAAVKELSFTVKSGEMFGLLGPNGAGKSTIFKVACGLLKPTHGTVSVLGYNPKEIGSLGCQEIGYMAQKFSLYDTLSVQRNLEFFAGVYGLSRIRSRLTTLLLKKLFILLNLDLIYKQRLQIYR